MAVTPTDLQKAVELARAYGATKVVLFGSALTAPHRARDLDIACDIPGLDLFAYAGRLEEALRMPVDVIPLSPPQAFTDVVLRRGRVLYDAQVTEADEDVRHGTSSSDAVRAAHEEES